MCYQERDKSYSCFQNAYLQIVKKLAEVLHFEEHWH